MLLDPQTLLDIGGTPGPLPSEMNRCDERDLTLAFSDHGGRSRIWEILSCPNAAFEPRFRSPGVPLVIDNKYLRQQALTDMEHDQNRSKGPALDTRVSIWP